jgi:hypothetical protein
MLGQQIIVSTNSGSFYEVPDRSRRGDGPPDDRVADAA